MKSRDRIKEIRSRCLKATSGPWYAPKPGQKSPECCGCHSDSPTYNPRCINEHEVWAECNENEEWPSILTGFEEDVVFAAHARQDIPWLLKQNEVLQLKVKKLQKESREMQEECRTTPHWEK